MFLRSTWGAAARRLTGRGRLRSVCRSPRDKTDGPFDTGQWITAVGWIGWSALGAVALTPSSADPVLVAYVTATVGGAAGTVLAIWLGPGIDATSAFEHGLVPLVPALCLLAVGLPERGHDEATRIGTYFDGCLKGTAYDEDALLLTKYGLGTITLQPEHGPEIRFTRINPRPPSSDSSEPPDRGIAPANVETRRILDALGCR
ncbi:hypothetical protein CU254_41345 (plasmid) [Amycolatopsis sp. AA4]|uniref:hypothetical protein n=1 Tax=Actinomycetes TaxID=1760 RepID=UPI0001B55C0E|nr:MULTISPECIES: hypothetical protein [Actinomycetes]ATY17034.1 hypothetical protein CU254_41345 [Amycolatopsis sp. AA4]EFL12474.1 hypothetical protein SSMG_08145 [Streptomyces sp. AA4]